MDSNVLRSGAKSGRLDFLEAQAMRKTLFGAASAFAIIAGTALAQTATPLAPTTQSQGQTPATNPPAATQPMAPAEKMGAPGAASSQAKPSDQGGSTAAQQTPPAKPDKTAAAQTAEAKQPAGPAVRASEIVGSTVYGSDGKSLGSVSDAVVDSSSGRIVKLVISSGGFLGIGAKEIALDLDQVRMAPGEGIKANDVSQAQIDAMPAFDVASATQSLAKTPPPAPAPSGGLGGAPGAASGATQ